MANPTQHTPGKTPQGQRSPEQEPRQQAQGHNAQNQQKSGTERKPDDKNMGRKEKH